MDIQQDDSMQPQDESMDSDAPANSCMVPLAMLGEAKVGDTVEMKVKSVQGDMAELEPAMDDESEEIPSEEDAQKMPMDELEKKLPTAERE